MKGLSSIIFSVALVATMGVASCSKYDDSAIKSDISSIKGSVTNLEGRVQNLESQVKSVNTDISSLQTIVGSLQKNVSVTGVTETEDGYEIAFSDGKKALIRNGKDGKDGKDGVDGKDGKDGVDGKDGKDGVDGKDGKDGVDGEDGKDGVDGKDGKDGVDGKDGEDGADGHTPEIGVRQDSDGIWYWTLDGEWLSGGDGGKVKAVGTDGKDGLDGIDGEDGEDGQDGQDGQDGKDGVTPQLKIEEDYWYVSTDDGATWTRLCKAKGDDGADGDSFFESVEYDSDYVYLTLSDGTELKLSRGLNNVSGIAVVPDYSDGSVAAEAGDFEVRFDVVPSSSLDAVGALDISAFGLKAVYTKTRASAGDDVTLTIKSKSVSGGRLILAVDGSGLGEEFTSGKLSVSASLTIDDGVSAVTSGYFPLYAGSESNTINGYEYVEMGDGLKWATMNVGATKPEEYGDYFAWGETAAKTDYSWSTYFDTSDGGSTFTKYATDKKTVLDLEDDAARQIWKGSWRIPTDAEWTALQNVANFKWDWTDDYEGTGVAGRIVASKVSGYEGNTIFLPAAGRRNGSNLEDVDSYGYYWSSSLHGVISGNVRDAYFNSESVGKYNGKRYYGFSVRPVSE